MENKKSYDEGWPATEQTASVSLMAEQIPGMTTATLVGVSVVVLLTIAGVFLLGVLIDCRQQKLMQRQMGEMKRPKNKPRSRPLDNLRDPEADNASIANNMEEPGMSLPPTEVLQHIP